MSAWTLIPCLEQLRDEFDEIAPGRDRASDGSIGDTAHAGGGVSDHLPDEDFPALRGKDPDSRNEVHAIDVDADLRTPGLSMEMVVQHLLGRCRSGAETRLRYIIFNRRIWEASNDWRQRAYDGPSPHTEHAHFSASYDSAREASTASWHLEDLPVALTADDKDWLADTIEAKAKEAVTAILAAGKQSDGTPTSRIGRDAWAQGIPNGLRSGAPRDLAWEVFRDLGQALTQVATIVGAVATDVAAIKAELAKTPPPSA